MAASVEPQSATTTGTAAPAAGAGATPTAPPPKQVVPWRNVADLLSTPGAGDLSEWLAAERRVVDPLRGSHGQCPLLERRWLTKKAEKIPGERREDDGAPSEPYVSEHLDLLVLLGSAVLPSVAQAAQVWREHLSADNDLGPSLLVVGGVGHSTMLLYDRLAADPAAAKAVLPVEHGEAKRDVLEGRNVDKRRVPRAPEAAVFKSLLVKVHGITPTAIALESCSTNCGENAEFAAPIIAGMLDQRRRGFAPPSRRPVVGIIQDGTMQRRTLLAFSKHIRRVFASRTPEETPYVVALGKPHALRQRPLAYHEDRLFQLLLGELPRLRNAPGGYGPQGTGFIDANEDPPDSAMRAAELMMKSRPDLVRR